MTVIDKLSDRGGLIINAILLILVNEGNMPIKKLQWRLFNCGIFITEERLRQAVSVMIEKKIIKTAPKDELEKPVQETAAEAGVQ